LDVGQELREELELGQEPVEALELGQELVEELELGKDRFQIGQELVAVLELGQELVEGLELGEERFQLGQELVEVLELGQELVEELELGEELAHGLVRELIRVQAEVLAQGLVRELVQVQAKKLAQGLGRELDDTDLFAYTKMITTHPNKVIADLQAAVLTWQAGLHSTGGALKPEKCSRSLLAYRFAKGQVHIHTPHSHPSKIFLLTADGPTAIKWVAASEGITAVGIVQALKCKLKPQVDELQEKADEWANKVKEGWMDQRLAWTCLRSYPLHVCSISKTQGDAIIVQLYQALLPELGLQRKFPKIWWYAPRRFQALALPHPYFIQGQEQICLFQQLGLSSEISGGLLCISLDQAQLEIGRNVEEHFTFTGTFQECQQQ
jgi:hypothetical protein